jgi:carbonic anhydrase
MSSSQFLEPGIFDKQSSPTPDDALRHLMEGNERFASDTMTNLGQSLNILRQHTVEKQEPFAAVLSCADSRVPVELVFDQTIGQLFVARVAGNFVTPEILGSLEYGAAVLGTKLILVLGHSSCGAVTATMQGNAVPGQISSLFAHIQPAVDRAGGNLEIAVQENAKIQANLLAKSSPLLAGLVKEGKLKIVAGYYDLATGRVSLLEG